MEHFGLGTSLESCTGIEWDDIKCQDYRTILIGGAAALRFPGQLTPCIRQSLLARAVLRHPGPNIRFTDKAWIELV